MRFLTLAALLLLGSCKFNESDTFCKETCPSETDFACPDPDRACVPFALCGNGIIEGDETCDDANAAEGDGCSKSCGLEPGWVCVAPGELCVSAECGDGVIAGTESCDDGGNKSINGCDPSCQLIPGFHCPVAGEACERSLCGDGLVQGTEECDDRNQDVGDGCSVNCTLEPSCESGTCASVCGDGFDQNSETCDDGNTVSGDGCSKDCELERGFTCRREPVSQSFALQIPMTIRDFIASCGESARPSLGAAGARPPYGHPDFECPDALGVQTGMVAPLLSSEGKPVRRSNPSTVSDALFEMWYRSDIEFNRPIASSVALSSVAPETLRANFGYFVPITDRGFTAEDCDGTPCEAKLGDVGFPVAQNYHFTTETRFWFEFSGSEEIVFTGDDDVWIFVNNRIAVDLGGIHPTAEGSIDLSDVNNQVQFDMTPGQIYEVVVFHAERHTFGSTYDLVLNGFEFTENVCSDLCGDGIVSIREQCDLGGLNGNGDGAEYGGCQTDCTFEPRCGDGIVQQSQGETCDDGLNFGMSEDACAPGCQSTGARCGDGVVQVALGEECDDANGGACSGCSLQ